MNIRNKLQQGFSLVELMIAVVLGILIASAAIAMFLQSKKNFNQDDLIAEMQENGRHAMAVMTADLNAIGYLGGMLSGSAITNDPSLTPLNPGSDCGPGAVAYTTGTVLSYLSQTTAGNAHTNFNCIDAAEVYEVKANTTDVLAVKRVAGNSFDSTTFASEQLNHVYLRTNRTAGALLLRTNTTPAPDTTQADWEYLVHIYYIRNYSNTVGDGMPTLYRKVLASPPSMQTEDGGVAEGVEYFHVQFGIDNDNDGTPNYYVSNPDATQIQNAVSARLYVLVRSRDPDYSYANTKTYQLGDVSVGPINSDHYYRRVYTTTVMLRNPAYLKVFP